MLRPGECRTPPDVAEKARRIYSTGYQLANRYEGCWRRGRRHGKGTATIRGVWVGVWGGDIGGASLESGGVWGGDIGGASLESGEYRGEWREGQMHGKGN